MSIPVIDLFAGPGGLCEGFSKAQGARFDIVISIEKDEMAHETLRLRAAHRQLSRNPDAEPDDWVTWDAIIEQQPWNIVFDKLKSSGNPRIKAACDAAHNEAVLLELGPDQRQTVSREIRKRLVPFMQDGQLPSNTVLIGGPPCQAYSVAGRARNKGERDYKPENDHRHFLYEEYLHVIAEFRPAVFVMENVKGILSSRVGEGHIFQRILADLRNPKVADIDTQGLEYELVALGVPPGIAEPEPADFIIKAEEFGIPQARHRVIIMGVRKDVHAATPAIPRLKPSPAPTVQQVLDDLPSIRPEVSRRGHGMSWLDAFDTAIFDNAVRELSVSFEGLKVAEHMIKCRDENRARGMDPGPGRDRMRLPSSARRAKLRGLRDWYRDRETDLITNHESRAHMPSDLVRYLFVSAFGKVTGESPRLTDFPKCLLPEHKNIDQENVKDSIFKDRFRVQVAKRHSMTITSHIAKDGHAFIHFKPKQCRSLSVREAARLQTFPDSYVFLGNRTSQYTQVGNAVPPRLANLIAEIVAAVDR